MDAAIAGLLGATVGALASLFASLLSNWFLVRKERDQWVRSQQAEREKWVRGQEADYQKWLRETLQNIYSNCIHHLSNLLSLVPTVTEIGNTLLTQKDVDKWFSDYSEAQRWLGLLLVYYPVGNTQEFNDFRNLVISFSGSNLPDMQAAKKLHKLVIDSASKDTRLHSQ
ncbi:MAG: hypothetical protein M3R52_01200 [Acidobacteriota bacterium]|nr:hypothetical protein [Acidobacteriota bacterium]